MGDAATIATDAGKVVAERAIGELLLRLRRARSQSGVDHKSLLGEADRAVFKIAMEKRKQVLESALSLALAQFAIYRFALKSAPRPLRLAFGLGSVATTTQYTTHRASQVTADMLKSVLNLPGDSLLGNEARVILAGLEGPDGPYYASVVDESLRRQIYERALTQPRAADGSDVHPQLLLQPRLLRDMGTSPAAKSERPDAVLVRTAPSTRTVVNTRQKTAESSEDALEALPGFSFSSDEDSEPIAPVVFDASPDDLAAAPYDFAAAARNNSQGDANDTGDKHESRDLSPAERRAAERAARREQARAARMQAAGVAE
jgi:hypothetical protein